MNSYIYLIHPMRHEFYHQPTALEEQVKQAHQAYLEQASSAGRLLLAGACLDETFEVVLLDAESDEVARYFMLQDPAVKHNVMMAELHPLKISLMKGR
jgi:uncharacterized protein YciI